MALTSQFASGVDLTAAMLNASSIPVVSSTADITTPFTGQVIFSTTGNVLYRYTGSAWTVFDPNTTWISKGANESITSSTTIQNDDHFAFSVVANAFYALEGYVPYDGAVGGDIKCDFTVPAGSSFLWTNFGNNTGGVTQYNVATQGASVARAISGNGGTASVAFQPKGYLNTAGTAGTLQFRWAQNTSSGTATTVYASGWMKLTRMS